MRLLGAVALTGGVVACSTHERAGGQAGQDRNEVARNKEPQAGTASRLYVTPRGAQIQIGTASCLYAEKVMATVNAKWDEYRAMNPDDLPRRGYVRTVLTINKRGMVEAILVLNDKGSYPALKQLVLRAINDANIPPMTAAVVSSLPKQNHGRLKMEYMALYLPPR